MTIACGVACRSEPPQASFDRAYKVFLSGDLKKSQEAAGREYQKLSRSNPAWAWKFRILESKSLLWRGLYPDVTAILGSNSTPPDRESGVEILAIRGAAYARLHDFAASERDLTQAMEICNVYDDATCGDVIRSQGILCIQRGQVDAARIHFAQSLQFARARHDRFLEVTALLNLGLASLEAQHYDEAIDWTDEAYLAATELGAKGEAQTALGNLGWAYYNLGDSERSLELSLEAARRAGELGRIIGQLSWITNAGYVYASLSDYDRARQFYLQALTLANQIGGREDIYNAYRALALVSVTSNQLENAHKYSEQALDIARADNNRRDQLYPILVKGLIAARSHNFPEAKNLFQEVAADPSANAALKWRSEHSLGVICDSEKRARDADHYYRAALATFEAARSSLRRNDAKLPFAVNGSQIYDDYIHFLVAQGKPEEALRWAEYSRARTLAEGLQLLSPQTTAAPAQLDAPAIARQARGSILFYWLGEKGSFLWVITPRKVALFPLPPRGEIEAAAQRYRGTVIGPQDALASRDRDGQWLYENLVAPARSLLETSRVFIIPDGSLNNLNFETLLVSAPTPHFWIEDATVANAGSLRLLAAASRSSKPLRGQSLLLIGDSIPPNEKYPPLPKAAAQMNSVAGHFHQDKRQILAKENASPAAYLESHPEQFAYIHFVAHGTASRLYPLDSAIVLSKSGTADDSFKLYARDIMQHPLRAELVTISACYGASGRSYAGEGLVGLSWAFLRAGSHHVVAALWEVADASTERLMDKFYDELAQGSSPDVALRNAKLSLLHSEYHSAFYWGPFQLYSGS